MPDRKKRWVYFLLILITIPAGLSTRVYGYCMPDLVSKYGGDVLFATCAFWSMRLLFPNPSVWKITLWSYLVCITIEISQLYQAPWIQKIRATTPFNLLLGSDFVWSDWICYAAGTLMALLIALPIERKANN